MRKFKVSHDVMWNAIINCDPTFDGEFYYGVNTTGIFCRPSCKSKNPKIENVLFFDTSEEAKKDGFRPCKRCQSDLKKKNYNPADELIDNTIDFLQKNYKVCNTLDDISKELGISSFYLNRIFKKQKGITPRVYLERLKIKSAKNLLKDKSLDIVDVCFESGFKSLSTFYNVFNKHTGKTPKKYRKNLSN
jgi:AraC family transcriptional regulator of adaptative response / methylphosphotriester-DNA alkyltransferase methyltransferase